MKLIRDCLPGFGPVFLLKIFVMSAVDFTFYSKDIINQSE